MLKKDACMRARNDMLALSEYMLILAKNALKLLLHTYKHQQRSTRLDTI